MKNETRIAFNAYTAHLAELNGAPAGTQSYDISPTVQQTLTNRIQESADFLKEVNMPLVSQQAAQVLGMGASGPVAGRTNTDEKDRQPRNVINLKNNTYLCQPTDFDTFTTYNQLDTWAKFPDFQTRMRDHVTLQVARDRLMIGFNGIDIAGDTDIKKCPLLQDVNKGWLQHIRDNAPERVMSGIKIGKSVSAKTGYRTLDAAVYDATNSLLEPWYREDPDIIVILGRAMLTEKYLSLINSVDVDRPTEKAALATMILNKSLGGKLAKAVPYFPDNAILITKPSNLSIYTQSGTVRRTVVDKPERKRVIDYLSMDEDYVIEDYGACALIEGIELVTDDSTAPASTSASSETSSATTTDDTGK